MKSCQVTICLLTTFYKKNPRLNHKLTKIWVLKIYFDPENKPVRWTDALRVFVRLANKCKGDKKKGVFRYQELFKVLGLLGRKKKQIFKESVTSENWRVE